jgi:hypothetical protein
MKYIELNVIIKLSNFTKIVVIIYLCQIFHHNNATNFGYVKDLFDITTLWTYHNLGTLLSVRAKLSVVH